MANEWTVGGYFEAVYLPQRIAHQRQAVYIGNGCRKWWKPFWDQPLDQLNRRDIAAWHAELGKIIPTMANKCLIYLKAMYTHAITLDDYTGNNPAFGIRKHKEEERKRYVHRGEEMNRLNAGLSPEPLMMQAYFRLILATACRREEARVTRWGDIDLESGRWFKPKTKTTAHTIMITGGALELLRQLTPMSGCPWVFYTQHGNPWGVQRIEWHWQRIRARAGLEDVTIHDLRRTTAVWLLEDGVDLYTIMRVLNHRSITTTIRYLSGCDVSESARSALAKVQHDMTDQ